MKLRAPKLDPAQVSQVIAVALAMVVGVLVNAVAARRYSRWDWTSNHRYSLSAATVETLHGLSDPVQIWVLLGSQDPLEQSVKQLLVAYGAETTKLDIHYVDPDRDVVQLEDVRKRFQIDASRTDNGRVVTDAIVVVAHGDRHWYLVPADMIEATAENDRVKPREEQALTGAIRRVLAGEKTRVCFTTGHGEMSPLDASDKGAGQLESVLQKDNYQIDLVDTAAPNLTEPFKGCGVAIVAGLRGAFTPGEAEKFRAYLLGGGSMLLAASPLAGDTATGLAPTGLEKVLAPFGIALDEDLVLELDADFAMPGSDNSRFVVIPKKHDITNGLVREDTEHDVPRIVLQFVRSMRVATGGDAVTPQPLLFTSPKAVGYTTLAGSADWKGPPPKRAGDLGGPLVVGMAAERAKVSPDAPHGPRVIVVGSASPLTTAELRAELPVRGAAIFTESAISWLASKPQVLDVPERGAVSASVHLTDESRSELRRYVLLFMPGAVVLAGLGIGFARRASEGKKRKERKGRDAK
ncbi:MAG TPA: GldG family protein [Labilithrix sp.]